MKILIVDDASFTRLSLRKMLEQLKATVLEAGSAEEAWNVFKDKQPELVISDQNLPEKNGVELYLMIREAQQTAPFCLMTHRPDAALISKAISAGISHVLSKPIDPTDLKKMVGAYFTLETATVEVKPIAVTLNDAALTVALDASKRAKLTVEAYLSKMLNQMLQPPEKVEAAGTPATAKV